MTHLEVEDKDFATNDHPASASSEISQAVAAAIHLLPTQGPLEVFVHHNTLHVFEDLSFHAAVKRGWECYHAEPYFSELEYRRLYQEGRITDGDLKVVLTDELKENGSKVLAGLGATLDIRLSMLQNPLYDGPKAELRWVVAETDALDRFRPQLNEDKRLQIVEAARKWIKDEPGKYQSEEFRHLPQKFGSNTSNWSDSVWESFSLHLLWQTCLNGIKSVADEAAVPDFIRPRDLLFSATGNDIDRGVHEVLIRFCAAFVDQGYSDWKLPNRERGFYESFVELNCVPSKLTDGWLRNLPEELGQLKDRNVTAEESIEASLQELGIPNDRREAYLTQTLLSLKGWAGMIWQLESGVDWVVHQVPEGSLTGLLAVQLILEKHAICDLGNELDGHCESPSEVIQKLQQELKQPESFTNERRAFLFFQVAQYHGWTVLDLERLSHSEWKELCDEIGNFSAIERRRIYHEAYERQYRITALDAFSLHSKRRQSVQKPWGDRPEFQIVTCIDDREESFRRHLEEVQPKAETFGAAGFFAIAIYYRGAADGFYKPLCPGVVTPDHYVQEDVGYSFEGVHQSRAVLRKRLGLASHAFHTRSRSFVGGIFTGIVGSLATAPLVARVLFPRLTSRIRSRFGSLLHPPPVTNLQLERYEKEPGPTNGHIGYTTDEMAGVVLRLLQDIGLTKTEDFSRLFIVCGHGSSSLNNPHESAYCCGACAGKRGGPNARAFAQMANDWRVRAKVAAMGIAIPEETVFIGAYHNTCDDSVVFYDLDRMPGSHRKDFESARADIDEARRRNAHERCRRFDSAPLTLTPDEALRHVEERAQDISQARPEYNHATNALCIVGKRDWSRGLFLDRRAFLTSYDSTQDDDESSILFRILSAAIPVCAGINLEYYFSCVDPQKYGSGSKLPHNIVSMLGVMEGTSSDLRTGLYQQMIEIHEPLRLTCVIETTPEAMLSIMERNEAINRLVRNEWVHLAVICPDTSIVSIFKDGAFQEYTPSRNEMNEVTSSIDCYQGSREHLPFLSICETEVSL